jgi:hypothetical protein
MTHPQKPSQPDYLFVRMNPAIYEQLEKEMLSRCAVSATTTPIEAGRIIGIQETLRHLRNGYFAPPSRT